MQGVHPACNGRALDLHDGVALDTLTVGACWHGHDQTLRHALEGYLAGLSVLVGRREHSEVLKCLVQCSESLQLPATNLLEPGMEMVTNSHGSQVETTFVSSATAHPTLDEDGRRELSGVEVGDLPDQLVQVVPVVPVNAMVT